MVGEEKGRGEEEEEGCHLGVFEVSIWLAGGALVKKKELFVVAALSLKDRGGQHQGLVEGIEGEGDG